ncbi:MULTISPECIES: nickel-dependent hydrogenase large subunit [Metallosphaera]|uniref:Coenzyme F420-reducing hydrogenase alpha subunit-like protein n=4 Tax=Metallosphaera TaxID=41980 RepID=A4YF90_METS5|nr:MULTISPECIES: nickel-dependent hydrogenase large subunit [Metallosphaera]ABP95092.1 Coenzyme F420-reducing hydrogenase alpha subunit-like protein [Metallosphaera sedula DSM 5348]AIM27078.1 Coenzyme F420-reducing hydrogenase alpha subunit-like protein [Metallosphaera sedula]AKV73991.1 hydrogenase [Metallosphaera sedula]AKV76230.1 hydrogenase [Metallosphaera sedula]AKV78483.1 hydrogenase [Metallosphaera sedula]
MLNPLALDTIDLKVKISDGKVVYAKSSGNKLRGYERMFIGKDPRELPDIIPRVLSTCAQSHTFAYIKAVGNNNLDLIGNLMVSLEIIESNIKHPYAYWLPYLGGVEYEFPGGKKFRKVSHASRKIRAIMEKIGGKWPSVDYVKKGTKLSFTREELKDVISFLESDMLGMSLQDFLGIKELEELRGDIRYLNAEYWRAGLGRYASAWAQLDVSKIDDQGDRVLYDGTLVEVGPLAQALTFDDMIVKLHRDMGPSPLLRELARVRVAAKLILGLQDLEIESEGLHIRGDGIGYLESIRGVLVHQVKVKDKVVEYRVIQPTTFNASPGGALENAVLGIPVRNYRNPWEISLAVSSLDSCFITNVEVYLDDKYLFTKRVGGFC